MKQQKKKKTNYQALLPLGMMFIVLGITIGKTTKPVYIAIGGLFLIIALAHKNKEKKH